MPSMAEPKTLEDGEVETQQICEKPKPKRSMGRVVIEQPGKDGSWAEVVVGDGDTQPEHPSTRDAKKWLELNIKAGLLKPGRYRMIRVAKVWDIETGQMVLFK